MSGGIDALVICNVYLVGGGIGRRILGSVAVHKGEDR